jgi:hypothetical protein
MSKSRDDRSDSEDEQDSYSLRDGGYTSVHLGTPSDVIEEEADLQDPYVSRIGGTPVRCSSTNATDPNSSH